MDKILINQILKQNIKNYDLIANDFDKKRAFLWPEIEATARYIAPKSLILDVGCGNGRLFPFVTKNNGKYLGFDISENLIKIAQTKYGEKYFFTADLLSYTTYYQLHTTFDIIYFLAVLHHIPSHDLRLQALQKIKSLLKPNGILILSVWNLWQKKYLKYILKEFLLKLIGKSKLDWGDCYIPYHHHCHPERSEGSQPISVQRYLHAFTLKELINLIKTAGFQITEKRQTKGNLLIIAKLKIDL